MASTPPRKPPGRSGRSVQCLRGRASRSDRAPLIPTLAAVGVGASLAAVGVGVSLAAGRADFQSQRSATPSPADSLVRACRRSLGIPRTRVSRARATATASKTQSDVPASKTQSDVPASKTQSERYRRTIQGFFSKRVMNNTTVIRVRFRTAPARLVKSVPSPRRRSDSPTPSRAPVSDGFPVL